MKMHIYREAIALIEVKNVEKCIGIEKKPVLREISFKVSDGASLAVLGTVGSGKTALMNILAGCAVPTSGKVTVDGVDLHDMRTHIAHRIGYLPIELYLYPDMTVSEYIDYILQLKKAGRKRDGLIDDALEQTGLSDKRKTLIRQLCSYDRAALKLAQAIAGNVDILIVDEPAAALKRDEAARLRALLKKLSPDYTFIMASQLLREANELCEEVLIINKGKIAANSSIRKMSSGLAGMSVLKLRLSADEKQTGEFIKSMSAHADVETLPSLEEGSSDMLLTYPSENDIRQMIWQETVKRNIPILEMQKKNVSMEEIFLQMTGENYRL